MRGSVLFGTSCILVCVVGLLCAVRPAVAGTTERVSIASDGTQGNDRSYRSSISADGRFVAFFSHASNLVPGDTNGQADSFVHDRQTGETTRVSVASDGTQGNSYSYSPSISADGRFVAFYSHASNLVTGDTNGLQDVFAHDRQTGQTTRVSVASNGEQANAHSYSPSLSADGRFVAFYSGGNNLVPGDTNGTVDIFVHDRQTGETTRVSVATNGAQGNSGSNDPSISGHGRFVAFNSYASNLVQGDTNGQADSFVHDRQTGETTRVSVASDGTQGNSHSYCRSLSVDGRFVSFDSYASNLIAGDTNGWADSFVHDRQTGQTTCVSIATDGTTQGNAGSYEASISADGRFVAFYSSATNLVPADTSGQTDVFVHDSQTGETTRVSVASDGTEGNETSEVACLSADGQFVAFNSYASNLVEGDTNGTWDVFVHDRSGVNLTVTTSGSGTGTVGLSPPGGGYEEGTTVILTAVASAGSVFHHWGGDLTGLANPTTILMDDDKTVIAYFSRRLLTVLSAPINGAAITGDEPGTTPYTTICTEQQLVDLTAPATMPGGSSRTYHFLYWLVDDVAQTYGQEELQLTMDTDHKATAVYDWRLPGDVTGDCLVNVLDMIFVRNHARTACSE